MQNKKAINLLTIEGLRLMAWKRNKGRQPFGHPTYLAHLPKKINELKGGEVHLKGTVEVTDLFKGAFLLCTGGRLEKVQVRTRGRKIATFLITGQNLDEMDSIYRSGQALVNPMQLREALNHLRDVMFEKLRDNEGRETDDRKRSYRGDQKRR